MTVICGWNVYLCHFEHKAQMLLSLTKFQSIMELETQK